MALLAFVKETVIMIMNVQVILYVFKEITITKYLGVSKVRTVAGIIVTFHH
jgi:hypothetical protein